jgi:hypothetical protein
MNVDTGMNVTGSIAYCPQQVWVINQTFRGNILFDAPFQKKRYQECIHVCGLEDDLAGVTVYA